MNGNGNGMFTQMKWLFTVIGGIAVFGVSIFVNSMLSNSAGLSKGLNDSKIDITTLKSKVEVLEDIARQNKVSLELAGTRHTELMLKLTNLDNELKNLSVRMTERVSGLEIGLKGDIARLNGRSDTISERILSINRVLDRLIPEGQKMNDVRKNKIKEVPDSSTVE